jgi:predicted transcriptional regulator of viral defense system
VFAHILNNADRDGLWTGNASTVAAEFNVSEDEAYDALGELCDRGHVEKLVPGTYAISEWPERDEPADDLPT